MSDELLPCPFCNRAVPEDLSDTLYPSGIYWRTDPEIGRHYIIHSNEMERAEDDNKCWEMNCTENMGGCGASIYADSRDEVIAKWNKRPALSTQAAAPFPQSILELIKEVARREDTEQLGTWNDENGEPMQDDADTALAWISAVHPAPCEHLRGDVGSRWCALAERPAAPSPVVPWAVNIDNDYKPPRLRLTIGVQSFNIYIDHVEEEPDRIEWYREMLTKAMLDASPSPVACASGRVPLSEEDQHELWMRITGGDIDGWGSAREFARRLYAPGNDDASSQMKGR